MYCHSQTAYSINIVTVQNKKTTQLTSWGIFVESHEYSRINLHACYAVVLNTWLITGITIARFPHVAFVTVHCWHCWKHTSTYSLLSTSI